MTRLIDSATTTTNHSPGTATLETEPATVAMTNTVDYILDRGIEIGIDDLNVEWYEEDDEQKFRVYADRNGHTYEFIESHPNGKYHPKPVFYRAVEQSLERLQERFPEN